MSFIKYFIYICLFPLLAIAGPKDEDIRAQTLFKQLRCVVCEGQSLADSQADIAVEMRSMIREQMASGQSDSEILIYFTERYGDSVLMNPPVKSTTIPLWLAPILLLIIGLLLYRKLYS
jgi:cytochrome c-type biogenesis protein CcmH